MASARVVPDGVVSSAAITAGFVVAESDAEDGAVGAAVWDVVGAAAAGVVPVPDGVGAVGRVEAGELGVPAGHCVLRVP
jgi:hypothetical protein